MESILKFKLPEESTAFKHAVKGNDLSCIIWSLDQWLRHNYKRDREDNTPKDNEISIRDAKIVRTKLRNIMIEYGLTFDNEIFI